MKNTSPTWLITGMLMLIMLLLGAILARLSTPPVPSSVLPMAQQEASATSGGPTATASETIPPNTPLATLTPSNTLRPPPTLEPPTPTRPATLTPSVTPTSTVDLSISIPGLRGAETATPTMTPGCVKNEDWQLTYTVQRDDALARIAELYGTSVDELVEGNCLTDANLIVVGQVLRVPGEAQPNIPQYDCTFELLTPFDGTLAVPAEGELTFNWRGPRAHFNLIRIIRPDNSMYERVIELRQNESINLIDHLGMGGTYTWYVYPLDENFVQIPCHEGGPWKFTKPESPTPTPTPTDTPEGFVGP
jgi:LysM repeat protein